MTYTKSRLRIFALLLAVPAVALGGVTLLTNKYSTIVAHGPIQEGHIDVECASCHTAGDGSTRQQIQANLFYILGMRSTSVNFGHQAVTSDQCLDCHERPNERHPIYRFNEPRFAEVRREHKVNSCLGCHSEHEDARVSVSNTICSSCHDDLVLKNDPLDVEHVQLVADEAWSSCLGCHDFHGNHPHDAQTRLSEAFDVDVINDYFGNGLNPYGDPKHYEAKAND